jgi:hypothetical protein
MDSTLLSATYRDGILRVINGDPMRFGSCRAIKGSPRFTIRRVKRVLCVAAFSADLLREPTMVEASSSSTCSPLGGSNDLLRVDVERIRGVLRAVLGKAGVERIPIGHFRDLREPGVS